MNEISIDRLFQFFDINSKAKDARKLDLILEHIKRNTEPLRYQVVSDSEHIEAVRYIRERLDQGFLVSGAHRKNDWERGWGEVYRSVIKTGVSLLSLSPKDVKSGQLLRVEGCYAKPLNPNFERDLLQIAKLLFVFKFFSGCSRFHEFGCGTGHNLFLLSKVFADAEFMGYDWADESVGLLNHIKSECPELLISGENFDFYRPSDKGSIRDEDCVLTFAALEQVGDEWVQFLDLLLQRRPRVVLQMEPWYEGYTSFDDFDALASDYHERRGYLKGYFPRLEALERAGAIKVLFKKRLGIGSIFHEATTFIAWRPI
jgi:hypothetical protein